MPDSSISKFFEKTLKERLGLIADFSGLSKDELKIMRMQRVEFLLTRLMA